MPTATASPNPKSPSTPSKYQSRKHLSVSNRRAIVDKSSHWQLRHYISHPENDVLYYASGQDIFYLNTTTKKRKHITTLPFEARCTASGFGYVCVGGEEEGHFAIIKLEGRTSDVDAPLPLDYRHGQRSTPQAASVKVERIGEEIVNSISIHRIQDEEAHLYDVVAVLTNNDKTVRIYSLLQGVEDYVLDFPFAMNHATVSPDGKVLVAVGDVNKAFFYTREMREGPPQIPKPHNRLNMLSVKWNAAGEATLHIPNPTPYTGYFTTAWSPSGHLLAVGSEAGFVTVFDMQHFAELEPEDIETAIIACVASSRPNVPIHMHPGAVRSMLFSPEPWDLLIWAEDQGRVCIGDLRSGLRVKQVINLDPKGDDFTKLPVGDYVEENAASPSGRALELEEEFLRRHAASHGTHHIDEQLRQRMRRHHRTSLRLPHEFPDEHTFQDDPHGLTAHEQQILESLRTSRQREEARAQGSVPRSVNYTSSSLFSDRPNRTGTESAANESLWPPRNLSGTAAQDYDTLPELSRYTQRTPPIGQNASDDHDNSMLRLHANQGYDDLRARQAREPIDRQGSPSPSTLDRWQPRRRSSVLLSASGLSGAPAQRTIPPHAMRAQSGITTTPPNEEEGPWRTITNAMSLARGPLFETTNDERERDRDRLRMLGRQRDRLRELQNRLEANAGTSDPAVDPPATLNSRYELLRDATSAVRGLSDSYDVLRRRGVRMAAASTATGREIGVRTAGLAIARDGSTVWAATEEGVFEIKLALKSRLLWPSVDMK